MTAVPPAASDGSAPENHSGPGAHSAPETDPIPPKDTGTGTAPGTGSIRVIDETPRRKGRWRRFLTTGSLDIQSKLLVMLLAVSVLAALVVGVVGYVNGRTSLQAAALNQVTSLRESRITELKRSFSQFTSTVVSQSRNASVIGATKDFEAGWRDLQDEPVAASDQSKVDGWYQDSFVPQLDAASGGTANPQQFAPTRDPETYLQARYTTPFTDYDKAIEQDDAGDGSAWSAAHAEYQPY